MYRKILYLLSVTAVICIVAASYFIIAKSDYAFAKDLKISGNENGLIVEPDSTLYNVTNMNPGDSNGAKIDVQNNYQYPFELYMKAEKVTDGSMDDGADLCKKLVLNVSCDDKIIYSGPISGFDGNSIYIGKFASGDAKSIKSSVSLDGPDTGNEYQNKTAKVNWVFTVNVDNSQQTGTTQTSSNMPKTGDGAFVLLYASCVFLIVTGCILVVKAKLNK